MIGQRIAVPERDRGASGVPLPYLVGIGLANPARRFGQRELLDLYRVEDDRIRSLFLNSAIESRNLELAPLGAQGVPVEETQGELLDKHRRTGLDIGTRALRDCLRDAGRDLAELGYLCCVSSTGWLTPGFSALLIREVGLATDTARLDVVGMGCNAGLNGLNAVAGWAARHPGQLAVLLCVEVCSAAYVFDGTLRTAVVNSLFGDGAAALALTSGGEPPPGAATIRDFASHLIPDAIGAMRYDWDRAQGKFSFFLDRDVPYVVGAHAEQVVDRLLKPHGLGRRDIAHWVVHSGGKKVIDAVKINLGLTDHDVRHTTGVLRDHGNLSSGSFLFSLQRLRAEGVARPSDYGVFMTMGPGSTIETALVQW